MSSASNLINWFEIPVKDFERAKSFYEGIFDFKMKTMEMGDALMGFFKYEADHGVTGGAICKGPGYLVTNKGPKLYFNGNPDLSIVLNRVNGHGGEVLVPKELITPEIGYMAVFKDTEGNHIYLHSEK